MHELVILYVSARPDQIVPAIQLADLRTQMPISWYVYYNGPSQIDFSGVTLRRAVYDGELPEIPNQVTLTNHAMRQILADYHGQDQQLIIIWSDDFEPEVDWDQKLIPLVDANPSIGLFQPDDCLQGSCRERVEFPMQDCTVQIGRLWWWRDFNGGVGFPPHYVRYWGDVELSRRAHRDGQYLFIPQVKVQHRHWVNRRAHRAKDPLDSRSARYLKSDGQTYNRRLAAGYPIDW